MGLLYCRQIRKESEPPGNQSVIFDFFFFVVFFSGSHIRVVQASYNESGKIPPLLFLEVFEKVCY